MGHFRQKVALQAMPQYDNFQSDAVVNNSLVLCDIPSHEVKNNSKFKNLRMVVSIAGSSVQTDALELRSRFNSLFRHKSI